MAETASPERPRRSDARNNRAALLAAARELVAESGPEALTVVSVARRAGLNRSTAYQHFKSRDELVRAVSDVFAEEVSRLFREPRPFGEQVEYFVRYFREHPDHARIWLFRLLDGQGGSNASLGWGDYIRAIERLAASPRSQDGIDAEMFGIIGLNAALVWSLMADPRGDGAQGGEQTARFARELKRLYLYGALRPEKWPELVAELEAPTSQTSQTSD